MSQALATVMIWAGFLICLIASAGGWISVFRLARINRALPGEPAKQRIGMLVALQRALIFAEVAAAGVWLITFALAAGYGVSAWAPALTGGLLLGVVAVYAYDSWLISRLGRSRT